MLFLAGCSCFVAVQTMDLFSLCSTLNSSLVLRPSSSAQRDSAISFYMVPGFTMLEEQWIPSHRCFLPPPRHFRRPVLPPAAGAPALTPPCWEPPGFVTPLCLLTFNRLFIPQLLFKLHISATGSALFTKQSGLLLFLPILCYHFYLFSPLNSGRCDFPDPP